MRVLTYACVYVNTHMHMSIAIEQGHVASPITPHMCIDMNTHVQRYEHMHARIAIEQGHFTSQITPVTIPGKAGSTVVDADEEPLKVA